MNKLIVITIFIFPSFVFSKKLNTVYDYMQARTLSEDNIQLNFGFSILEPPHSLKNSLFKKNIVQFEYRKEKKSSYIPPIAFKTELTMDSKQNLQAIALYPGIQLPRTHRKTPVYIGLSLGSLLSFKKSSQMSFIFQVTSIVRLYQWSQSASSLLLLNVNYKLNQAKWWRTPYSLILTTGLNVNI